ncbi:hypothetical protein [Streptomyces kronopolitis]|uniref:hypothetical protein n=1 Tax=Streptomyces kronopolitis TaxID=1612435 RepID=UPI0034444605
MSELSSSDQLAPGGCLLQEDGTTIDVYTHVAQDTQREAISHMDRLLKRRLDRN